MTTLAIAVAVGALVGGFVFGVLFGRRNAKLVEKELAQVKADQAAVKAEALKAGVKL